MSAHGLSLIHFSTSLHVGVLPIGNSSGSTSRLGREIFLFLLTLAPNVFRISASSLSNTSGKQFDLDRSRLWRKNIPNRSMTCLKYRSANDSLTNELTTGGVKMTDCIIYVRIPVIIP